MNRFKKWLFIKALNFVLRNINEYEDQIFVAIGLDTKLAALIDMVTDLLLNLYLKWRENHSQEFSTENFPKLEKWLDREDPFGQKERRLRERIKPKDFPLHGTEF